MGLTSLFESRKAKEKKAAVMNAIAVMVADGRIDPSEMALLDKIRRRVGLSEKKLKKMLKMLSTRGKVKVQFIVPRSRDERVFQVIDLVSMMIVDGKIDAREVRVTEAFATRLGFSPSTAPNLVKGVIGGCQAGHGRAQVSRDVAKWAET